MLRLLSLMLCCAVLPIVKAQQLYKSVGPDGKIIFSDKPSINESTKLSVMKGYTLRPIEMSREASSASAATMRVKRESRPGLAGPVIPPEIEAAMLAVMGRVALERKFEHFCANDVAAAKAFAAATSGWRRRNAAYIEQQKRLLMEVMSPHKRAELLERDAQSLRDSLAKVQARTPVARIEWCESTAAQLNGGQSDLDVPAMLAITITPYRAL